VFEQNKYHKKTECTFCSENLLGVILAPNERWNRALHMRVERPKGSSERVSNTVEPTFKTGIKYWINYIERSVEIKINRLEMGRWRFRLLVR
jgi:hypothetical protein